MDFLSLAMASEEALCKIPNLAEAPKENEETMLLQTKTNAKEHTMGKEETSVLAHAKLEKANLETQKIAMADEHSVTLMVTAIEKEADYIQVRLAHLMAHQFFHAMTRVLVVDAHGNNLSASFLSLLHGLQSSDLIDSWSVVDYSKKYVHSIHQTARWTSDYVTRNHAGNLVYYFMLDICRTRYCAHFDLDVAFWATSGYSWIEDGITLLEEHTDAVTVRVPMAQNNLHYLEINDTLKKGLPDNNAVKYSCEDAAPGKLHITAQHYLMQADRYRKLIQSAKHTTCGGNLHWEHFVSCAACQLSWKRIDLIDSSLCRYLHFPTQEPPHLLDSILTRCFEQDVDLDYGQWDQCTASTVIGKNR